MTNDLPRVPLLKPLTPSEKLVVTMLGHHWNYETVAEELGIGRETVKRHAQNAAAKIPGDWPAQVRCALWFTGAPLHILTRRLVKEPYRLQGEAFPVQATPPLEDCA